MEFTLSQITQLVCRAFYRQFDGVEGWFWCEAVFDDSVIVRNYDEDPSRFYRVGYTFTPGTGTDYEVTFDPRDQWEETVYQWVPVEREAARVLKDELIRDVDSQAAHTRGGIAGGGIAGGEDVIHRSALKGQGIRMASDDNRSTFWIMTDEIARDGAIVDADGLDTSHYRENPVVLWQHGTDPQRGAVPIAKCVDLVRKDETRGGATVRGWLATIEWEPDAFAQDIRDKVKRGVISMTSLGWQGRAELVTRDGTRIPYYRTSEMIEFSVVGVGSDRNALVTERGVERAPALSTLDTDFRTVIREEVTTALRTSGALPPLPQQRATAHPAPDPVSTEKRTVPVEWTADKAITHDLTPEQIRAAADARQAKVREAALRRLGRA